MFQRRDLAFEGLAQLLDGISLGKRQLLLAHFVLHVGTQLELLFQGDFSELWWRADAIHETLTDWATGSAGGWERGTVAILSVLQLGERVEVDGALQLQLGDALGGQPLLGHLAGSGVGGSGQARAGGRGQGPHAGGAHPRLARRPGARAGRGGVAEGDKMIT